MPKGKSVQAYKNFISVWFTLSHLLEVSILEYSTGMKEVFLDLLYKVEEDTISRLKVCRSKVPLLVLVVLKFKISSFTSDLCGIYGVEQGSLTLKYCTETFTSQQECVQNGRVVRKSEMKDTV